MYLAARPSLDTDPRLLDTWVGRLLAGEPARLIDVGARGGFDPMLRRLGRLGSALGFEPDPDACAALRAEPHPFAGVRIEPLALGAGGPATFHSFSGPNNGSLLPTNLVLTSRYRMRMFERRASFPVVTHRLDDVVLDPARGLAGFGEIIKLDTQGSEHLILEHAEQVLRTNAVALVTEAWFCEIYQGQPLFHDLCALLAGHGLRFYGFSSFFLRSGKRLDKRREAGRERALYADAVFLRDPLDDPTPTASPRQAALLIAFAMISGYFDLALEYAEAFGGADADLLASVIRDQAAADREAATADLRRAVASVDRCEADAMVAMGQFADRWRAGFDYTDVPPV